MCLSPEIFPNRVMWPITEIPPHLPSHGCGTVRKASCSHVISSSLSRGVLRSTPCWGSGVVSLQDWSMLFLYFFPSVKCHFSLWFCKIFFFCKKTFIRLRNYALKWEEFVKCKDRTFGSGNSSWLEEFFWKMEMLGLKGNIKLEKTCLSFQAWPQQRCGKRRHWQPNKDEHEGMETSEFSLGLACTIHRSSLILLCN